MSNQTQPIVWPGRPYPLGSTWDGEDERGRRLSDENFLALLNAHHEDVESALSEYRPGARWSASMDTSGKGGLRPADTYDSGTNYPLQARSVVVLMERRTNGKKEESHEAPS